jgi:hypothetical protein
MMTGQGMVGGKFKKSLALIGSRLDNPGEVDYVD